MQAYEGFAPIYDLFMGDIDYDGWTNYIKKIWEKYNKTPKLIAELGCGTGNITGRLAKMGYDMIGIDISEEMLLEAKEKAEEENLEILYLLQDMTEFELFGTVDIIISICDSLNYITEKEDLVKVFKLVNNYLDPKGLFIFDLNTEYKFKNILAENSFSQTDEDAAYIWENTYDEESKINEYYVNFFVKDEESGLYERIEECHYEKAYSVDEIKDVINESGMEFVAAFDAFTFDEVKPESERIYIVARENGK
jgi:SAM-dependent methyltransferase